MSYMTQSRSYSYPITVRIIWYTLDPVDWYYFDLLEPPMGHLVHLRFREEKDGSKNPDHGKSIWVNASSIDVMMIG